MALLECGQLEVQEEACYIGASSMINLSAFHTEVNEDGDVRRHVGYVFRVCVKCGKRFLISIAQAPGEKECGMCDGLEKAING